MMASLLRGVVSALRIDKGYGFIQCADGRSLFFHLSSVKGIPFKSLREGHRVVYREQQPYDPRGPRAEYVAVDE